MRRVLALVPALLLALPSPSAAQDRRNPDGEWRYQSADAWGTRYSPVDQINATTSATSRWRGCGVPTTSAPKSTSR